MPPTSSESIPQCTIFSVTAETAPLLEIKEDDLQDAHSGDAASNIGTNVSTVLPSLSPTLSSPCLPSTYVAA